MVEQDFFKKKPSSTPFKASHKVLGGIQISVSFSQHQLLGILGTRSFESGTCSTSACVIFYVLCKICARLRATAFIATLVLYLFLTRRKDGFHRKPPTYTGSSYCKCPLTGPSLLVSSNFVYVRKYKHKREFRRLQRRTGYVYPAFNSYVIDPMILMN